MSQFMLDEDENNSMDNYKDAGAMRKRPPRSMLAFPRPLTLSAAISVLASVACGGAVGAPQSPAPEAQRTSTSTPEVHDTSGLSPTPSAFTLVGDRLFPESIAYDADTRDFYVGGLLDGSIVRGNAGAASVELASPAGADGRVSAAGIKIDRQKRLWVAAGESGKLFVYDVHSFKPLATFSVGKGEKRVVNDIAIADDGEAYVTDSSYPALYHVTMTGKPTLEELPVDAAAVPYTGAYNLNGIVVTPDQKALLLVQTSTGKLFRFERSTRSFSTVDLGGASVPAGDGLALAGRDLFVACNATRSIARVRLAGDFRSGRVLSNAPNTSLAFPTAIAIDRDALLVVNSQIDALGSGKAPLLPFTITRVAITALQ